MQVICAEDTGIGVADLLRENGYAVTVMEGAGQKRKRHILLLYVSRKKIKPLSELIKGYDDEAVITVSDKKAIYGGFGMLRK